MLSSEMSHGMTQIGVPHFTHAMLNSVCDGVDAETHKIICCHQVHCCCCKIAANTEDCWDLFEDETLFGCLFEMNKASAVGLAGETTAKMAHIHDSSEHLNGICTNTTNSDSLQNDHLNSTYTSFVCYNTSSQSDGPDQSTSLSSETVECLDLTQENIRFKQEEDPVLKTLLQWKRDGEKPSWSTVALYGKELKAYWHEWNVIVLKENILYKKRFRDICNDSEHLFLVPASLRKEVFRQLHEYVTAGHLGRRKTYDKIRKRFYWNNMYKDMSYWCRICSTCGSRKMPHRHGKAPMRQYNVGFPMERIGLDICGPYPVSKKGHKYLMVVSCYFSKWVDAIPLKTQDANM